MSRVPSAVEDVVERLVVAGVKSPGDWRKWAAKLTVEALTHNPTPRCARTCECCMARYALKRIGAPLPTNWVWTTHWHEFEYDPFKRAVQAALERAQASQDAQGGQGGS